MAGRIYAKHQKRKKKMDYYIRERVGYFGVNYHDVHADLWECYHTEEKWRFEYRARSAKKSYNLTDEQIEKAISGPYWEAQDMDAALGYCFLYSYLSLSITTYTHRGNKGTKGYYHKQRRLQTRQLEHYALVEDEERFERIVPDGFRGAIGWDYW